jgi:tetratricopeptide (TPR) repeat protein
MRGWPVALLVFVPWAIYAQTWSFGLLEWDDPQHITQNPHLVPLSWTGLGQLWRGPYFAEYVPVFYMFLAGEIWLAGHWTSGAAPNWGVLHAGGTLLHVAAGLLVYVILLRLINARWPAALGALLFAVHPLQVESVAWISETRGLLATTFGLLSLWLYIRSADRAPDARWLVWLEYAAGLVAFLLALLSKPSAVAVPLVLAVIELGCLRRGMRRAAASLAPWFLLAVALVLITKREQSGQHIAFSVPYLDRPRLAGDALTFYLYKLAWPWRLAADYGRPARRLVGEYWTWLTALVPLALTGLLVWRRQWKVLLGLAIFVAALLPVSGLIQFSYQTYSTVADRYVYLAMLGAALALASWLAERGWRGWYAVTLVVLAIFAAKSFVQAGYWRDQKTLFTHALAVSPLSPVAWENLGLQWRAAGQPEKALECFARAQRVNPDVLTPYLSAGATYVQLGRWSAATEQFARAARLAPENEVVCYSLGTSLLNEGKFAQAERYLARSLRANPQFQLARCALALALAGQGQDDAALAEIDLVLKREPNNIAALVSKGQILAGQGKRVEAESVLQDALRISPSDAHARQALEQLRAQHRGDSRD